MCTLTLQSMPPQSKAIYSYREWPSFSRLHDNHGSQTKNLSVIEYVFDKFNLFDASDRKFNSNKLR